MCGVRGHAVNEGRRACEGVNREVVRCRGEGATEGIWFGVGR